jgi:DNA-binding FadR family transcriptional regulator
VIGIQGAGGHAAEAVEEHDAIYHAIRDGQPEAAADATVVHLDVRGLRRSLRRAVGRARAPHAPEAVEASSWRSRAS